MDKYLLELLKEVNTIIIPGLGALTITNKDTGEIMFMSYLKHDDGKLSSYISENEGVDENEAKNLIAKYVREISASIDKGESYDMFKFGTFFKDGDEIGFKNWGESEKEEKEVSTEKKVSVKKPAEKKKTAVKETEKKTVKKATTKPATKASPKKESPKAAEKKASPKTTKKAAPAKPKKEIALDNKSNDEAKSVSPVAEKPKEETKPEMNILQKEEMTATANKLEALKKQKENSDSKKKRGVGFWMLLVLIAVIVAGGTYVGFNYDTVKQHIPFLADKTLDDDSAALDEMKEILGENEDEEDFQEDDSEIIEEQENNEISEEEVTEENTEEDISDDSKESEEIVETPPQSYSDDNLPFLLVAGAFSSEANAMKLADKLRSSGHDIIVTKGNGMNMVSIGSYATRSDASEAAKNLTDVAPKAWIFKRN